MANRARAYKILFCLLMGWSVMAACSDERADRGGDMARTGAASGLTLSGSAAARERVANLRKTFRAPHDRPNVAQIPGMQSPAQDVDAPLIGPGVAAFANADADRVQVLVRSDAPTEDPKSARVELPSTANGPVLVEDIDSKVALSFSISGAEAAPIETHDGIAVYAGALGAGVDVAHRPSARGTEDFLIFASKPHAERVTYSVDVSKIAGLRLVGGVLEALDANGAPRLRMSPPYVVDAQGTQRPARVAVHGCAFDADPAAPWGRPVLAPGASSCRVTIEWDGSELAYPIVLDPVWTVTGSMSYQRYSLQLTWLSSTGRVLASGGYGCTGSCTYVAVAELYDPATGTWATTGSMVAPRYFHKAGALVGGNVLVAGGLGSTGYLQSAELYNPSTGLWTSTGSMTSQRYLFTLTVMANGRALAAGGYGCLPSCTYQATAEVYDPSTGSWTATPNLAAGRYGHVAALLSSGRVLVAGGYGITGYLASAERYDPTTNTWSSAGTMTETRRYATATPISSGSKVLVAGGYGSAGYLTTAEIYDVSGSTWTATGSMSASRYYHAAALLANGKVLVEGGYGCSPSCTYQATSEVYDPGAGTWSSPGNMTTGRYYHDSALLADGSVLVAGGLGSSGYLSSAEIFKLVAQGGPCAASGECLAGYCVDGVCCNTQCTGLCSACTGAKKGGGLNGVCGPILSGTDPDAECADQGALSCGTTGVCNGSGACSLYPSGTQCGTPACASGQLTTYACNGGGACLSTQTACLPYICASGTACGTSCTSNAQCAASAWCRTSDSTCQPDQTNGATCTSASQCASGYCVDGFCCATACTGLCNACSVAKKGAGTDGDCGPVKDGTDPDTECADDGAPSCKKDGQCNGAGACRLYTKGTACGATTCSGNKVTGQSCDGFGSCVLDSTGVDCAPYVCSVNKCAIPCAADTDCTAGNFCETGTCKAKQANGATCAGGNACVSGYCVDGVCCATACTGLCQACSAAKKGSGAGGECGPVKDATDPDTECPNDGSGTCQRDGWCNGSGACRLYAKGTTCAASVCVGNSVTGQSCDGFGSCSLNATGTDCAPYVCNAGTCVKPCTLDSDCTPGNYCKAGACTPKQGNGAVCTGANQCQSGYCADGVCCITPCTGSCQACSAAKKGSGVDGDCAPVAAGLDPDTDCADDGAPTCQKDGACNGFGACRLYAKGAACGSLACVGNKVSGKFCDGFGTCAFDPVGTDCTPYVCVLDKCSNPCSADADCTAGNYCDAGTCKGKQVAGLPCTGGNQCQSSYCVDGVCCATSCTGLCSACNVAKKGSGVDGECGPVKDNTDPDSECPDDGAATCQRDGMCNGLGICRLYAKGNACGAVQCVGNLVKGKLCDGLGSCIFDTTGTDCAPYVCAGSGCVNPCATDLDCVPGNFCDQGACKGKLSTGAACTAGSNCASGYCVDNVCCATPCTGVCQACSAAKKGTGVDGQCEAVIDGNDPDDDCPDDGAASCKRDGKCNGAGLCRWYTKGTACGTTGCIGNFTKGHICDGLGGCEYEPIGVDCSPYQCKTDKCANPCAENTDCVTGSFCDNGTCSGKLPTGTACTAGTQCQSGYCVDGYCCDGPCKGQCEACDEAPNQGTCSPITGAPHGAGRPACKGSGTPCEGSCDGLNPAACGYPGSATECGSSCDKSEETTSYCAGNGTCLPAEPKPCSPYQCDGTAKCLDECSSAGDCVFGYTCAPDKTCTPTGATCKDDHTVLSPDGTTKDCTPYRCDIGVCKTTCASVDDCVLPAVCRPDHTCGNSTSGSVSDPSSGDCACRAPGRSSGTGPWAAGLLAVIAAFSCAGRRRGKSAIAAFSCAGRRRGKSARKD